MTKLDIVRLVLEASAVITIFDWVRLRQHARLGCPVCAESAANALSDDTVEGVHMPAPNDARWTVKQHTFTRGTGKDYTTPALFLGRVIVNIAECSLFINGGASIPAGHAYASIVIRAWRQRQVDASNA